MHVGYESPTGERTKVALTDALGRALQIRSDFGGPTSMGLAPFFFFLKLHPALRPYATMSLPIVPASHSPSPSYSSEDEKDVKLGAALSHDEESTPVDEVAQVKLERRFLRRLDWCLLSWAFLSYIMKQVDTSNYKSAYTAGMKEDVSTDGRGRQRARAEEEPSSRSSLCVFRFDNAAQHVRVGAQLL